MTAQLIQLRAQSAQLSALHRRFGNGCNDSGEQARIAQMTALANLDARVERTAREARRAQQERDAAFALAAGVPVIWAVKNLRGFQS